MGLTTRGEGLLGRGGRWIEKWKCRGKLRRGHEGLIDPELTSLSRQGEATVKVMVRLQQLCAQHRPEDVLTWRSLKQLLLVRKRVPK